MLNEYEICNLLTMFEASFAVLNSAATELITVTPVNVFVCVCAFVSH